MIKHIRKYVYAFSFLLAVGVTLWVKIHYPDVFLQQARLAQYFAFIAGIFLWLTMLIGPVYAFWTNLPGRALTRRARRSLGVSAFFFALAHGIIEVFFLLGGISGLFLLPGRFLLAVMFGSAALLLISIMAATSFDWAVKKLLKKWFVVHRIVYLAGALIAVHALMIGSHLAGLTFLGYVWRLAWLFLFALELIRLDRHNYANQKKWKLLYRLIFFIVFAIAFQVVFFGALTLHGDA